MSKIISKSFLKERLTKQCFLIKRYSNVAKDDDDLEKGKRITREKGSKAKAESIQEESYFHKEEIEQLKDLKKKMKKDKQSEADRNK